MVFPCDLREFLAAEAASHSGSKPICHFCPVLDALTAPGPTANPGKTANP